MRTWYEGVVQDVLAEWDRSQNRARWAVHIEYVDMADGDDEEYYHYFDYFPGCVKWRKVS